MQCSLRVLHSDEQLRWMTVEVPGRRDASIRRRKFSPNQFRLAAEFMPHIVWDGDP